IDDRFVQRRFRGTVIAPLEIRVVHHRSEDVRSAVGGVDGILVAELVRVAGWVPPDLSLYRSGVWIQQQLARVAARASLRRIWTSDAVPAEHASMVRLVQFLPSQLRLLEGARVLRVRYLVWAPAESGEFAPPSFRHGLAQRRVGVGGEVKEWRARRPFLSLEQQRRE